MTVEKARRNCPVISWSQTKTDINISIDLLLDDIEPDVKIKDKYLSVDAYGFCSADSGPQKYYFEINLFDEIDVDVQDEMVNAVGKRMSLQLKKKNERQWWPRLTAQPQKPNWIQIDLARWIPHENDDMDDDPTKREYRDIQLDYPGVNEHLQKQELGYRQVHSKIVYLIFYNLGMFIGYLYIILVLGIAYYRDGLHDSIPFAYVSVGNAMKFCQLLQYLEVMHPLFGYTKGSILFPMMQVTGRNFILFLMIDAEERIQTKPVIFYLFAVWASIECVRYPYYIMNLLQTELYPLTWLRYTMWIPLYPLGILCEGMVVLRNLPYFEETKRFSVSMPNEWNFTFCMCTFMKMYLIIGLAPGVYFIMKHMAKVRAKKLKTIKVNYLDHRDKDD